MTFRYRLDPALSRRAADRLNRGFAAAGWAPTQREDWDLDWIQGPPDPGVWARLDGRRVVNHLPGFAAFGHKGHLHRNLTAARSWAGPEVRYDFHPLSFSLPEDRDDLREAVATEPKRAWILKPPRGGQGQGISLVNDPEGFPVDGEWVAQEYIDRPHLIDDRKYVLRTWLVVTSLDPLVVYMHDNGVYKMTSRRFRSAHESLDDLPTHLTNPTVQARNVDVPLGSLNSDLHGFRRRLQGEGIDPAPIFERIRAALIQSVIACRDQALSMGRGWGGDFDGCFELLGPDILIDENLKPWVLELNTFPSLEVSRSAEREAAAVVRAAKDEMVTDLAGLLQSPASEPPLTSGGFERIWPGPDAARYTSCFSIMRPADRRFASRAAPEIDPEPPPPRVVDADIRPVGDGVALIHDGRVFVVNDIGAAVWLCLREGLTPDESVDELAAVFPGESRRRIESDVWDLLTGWARADLLSDRQEASAAGASPPATFTTSLRKATNERGRTERTRSA